MVKNQSLGVKRLAIREASGNLISSDPRNKDNTSYKVVGKNKQDGPQDALLAQCPAQGEPKKVPQLMALKGRVMTGGSSHSCATLPSA